jgi:carboxyl-terminal processing protease
MSDYKQNKNNKLYIYLPLILSLAVIFGIYIGGLLKQNNSSDFLFNKNISAQNKLEQVIEIIKEMYVDSVNDKEIEEGAINSLLENLDPHSYYISAKEFAEMNEPLEGNFDGIGVEFRIVKDTVVVIQPLEGGPSEKVGIMAGDRIIKVDTLNIAGNGITNKKVMKLLKGPRGTKVKLGIKRKGVKKILYFTITRDRIPINSVMSAYFIRPQTAYIKIARFARPTYQEFITKCEEFLNKGAKKIIVDLRGNGGGLLDAAIKISDEFLPKGNLIVYTEGRARPRKDYKSTAYGILENTKLNILIDESSASASEIVAGAIQDNDRGLIIGRRSFGKGLVQEQLSWPDGSALRLTVARYYTPSGRCIQKPYENGVEQYRKEAYERYFNGELLTEDSIHFNDSLKYYTKHGRLVYGGGGIMPDIFIPIDTSFRSDFLNELAFGGIFIQFTFDYADKNRDKLHKLYPTTERFLERFEVNNQIMNEFIDYAKEKGLKIPPLYQYKNSLNFMKLRLKAGIARNLYNDEIYYRILNEDDPAIKKALETDIEQILSN